MTDARQLRHFIFMNSRSFLIACLVIIASLLLPSASHAQQNDLLQRLQPVDTQT